MFAFLSNKYYSYETDMKPGLHPVGTPKFNMKRASIGVKKTPPTNKKKKSPKGTVNKWCADYC
jgi:hypothetical protein